MLRQKDIFWWNLFGPKGFHNSEMAVEGQKVFKTARDVCNRVIQKILALLRLEIISAWSLSDCFRIVLERFRTVLDRFRIISLLFFRCRRHRDRCFRVVSVIIALLPPPSPPPPRMEIPGKLSNSIETIETNKVKNSSFWTPRLISKCMWAHPSKAKI